MKDTCRCFASLIVVILKNVYPALPQTPPKVHLTPLVPPLLQEARGEKSVRARVCRNVDGLDTHLFEKALEVRRAFLADPAYENSSTR